MQLHARQVGSRGPGGAPYIVRSFVGVPPHSLHPPADTLRALQHTYCISSHLYAGSHAARSTSDCRQNTHAAGHERSDRRGALGPNPRSLRRPPLHLVDTLHTTACTTSLLARETTWVTPTARKASPAGCSRCDEDHDDDGDNRTTNLPP
jgi:hypothetical protein